MTKLTGEYKGVKEVFTFLDLETTDLDQEKGQIIEIAAIKTDLEKEIGRLEMRIALHPDQELSDFISELTGITRQDLVGGIPEQLAIISLGLFTAGSTVVAQYAPFDLSYLENRGMVPEFFIDTRTLSRLIDPEESASLKPTYKRLFGEEFEGHHRAINDVEATIRLFKRQIERAEETGLQRGDFQNVVIDSEERPLRYKPKHARVLTMDLPKRTEQ
jgi:DNA polymerase III subunit epsilon